MNLRKLNIGTRLAAGFALILLAASAMLAVTLVSNRANHSAMLRTLAIADESGARAVVMQNALLSGAVAVRSAALQSDVAGAQKDQAEADRQWQIYLDTLHALEAGPLGDDERALLARLAASSRSMSVAIKQAMDFATSFNPEQAAATITKKVNPLLGQAMGDLANLIALQKSHSVQAMAATNQTGERVQAAVLAAGAGVLAAAALLAWRLTKSITEPLRAAETASAKVAAGELDFEIDIAGHDEAARLLAALARMRGNLAEVVAHVRRNSESVANASSEIAQGNNDLSIRTEQQASALQQTAAAMEQLGTAVGHNADNARQASQLAQDASGLAVRGGGAVDEVIATMKGINDSSKKIADIIGVIDGIAFQTNILALNAAVEAARAGEQGRGFAVVAAEVRSLAGRSANAAREIKSLISASVERVEHGGLQVDRAGSTMKEVVEAIGRVAALMGEISSASAEQRAGVAQVGQAIGQMDQATQQNSALVEQSAAAAEGLKSQAAQLVTAVAVFKLAGA